jgi:hypothetical protein
VGTAGIVGAAARFWRHKQALQIWVVGGLYKPEVAVVLVALRGMR